MPAECPNCRQPIAWYRTFITPLWGSWRCGSCESLLGINKRRRAMGWVGWGALITILLLIVGGTFFVLGLIKYRKSTAPTAPTPPAPAQTTQGQN